MCSYCPANSYLRHSLSEIANFSCQCSASHQPIVQWASTEDFIYTEPLPNFPAPSFPIQTIVTPPVTTTKNRWRCPICPGSFSRWQERDRHELTHVPYFIHCPLPHCAWRGNRTGLFKKHWQQEDHRGYHEYFGHTPERSQTETFNPREILNQIASGALSLRAGEVKAIVLVRVKACELQKLSMWMDPWGRNKKHWIRQDQW